MQKFSVKTNNRTEFIDITAQIRDIIRQNDISSGLVTVFIPHTTAAVTINENADPDVPRDIIHEINKIVPFEANYHHSEGNSAAHIKSSLFGPCETIIFDNNNLQLGTWQGIYFCEFDGPRSRQVWVKLIK